MIEWTPNPKIAKLLLPGVLLRRLADLPLPHDAPRAPEIRVAELWHQCPDLIRLDSIGVLPHLSGSLLVSGNRGRRKGMKNAPTSRLHRTPGARLGRRVGRDRVDPS
jgi:hypothetical protein